MDEVDLTGKLSLKWTGLQEKGGGGLGLWGFYGISDRGGGGLGSCMESRTGGGVVLGLHNNAGPYPPYGWGGSGSLGICKTIPPPNGQYAAKNTSYNWKL